MNSNSNPFSGALTLVAPCPAATEDDASFSSLPEGIHLQPPVSERPLVASGSELNDHDGPGEVLDSSVAMSACIFDGLGLDDTNAHEKRWWSSPRSDGEGGLSSRGKQYGRRRRPDRTSTVAAGLDEARVHGILTLNSNGDAEPMVFDATITGYSNPALEELFILYESNFAPYRFIAICLVLLVPDMLTVASSFMYRTEHAGILAMSIIVMCTLIIAIIADLVLLHRAPVLTGDHPALLKNAKLRELLPTIAFVICGISLAVSQPYGHSFCIYLLTYDDRPDDHDCPAHLPIVFFIVIFMSAIMGRPRFAAYCLTLVVQLLVTVVMIFVIPSGDTVQYLVYELIIIIALIFMNVAIKYFDESQRRRLFEEYLVSEARKAEVQAREEALMNLLSTIVPRRLCRRLLQRGAALEDASTRGVMVLTDVHDAALVASQLLPVDAALAINRLGAVAQAVCQGLGLDHIRSVGDVTYATCNLLEAAENPCHIAVAYALTLFGSTPLPIRSSCAVGRLRGRVVGQRCIRYDVFGAAVDEAHELLRCGHPRTVHISAAAADALGPDVVSTASDTWPSAKVVLDSARIRRPSSVPAAAPRAAREEGAGGAPENGSVTAASEHDCAGRCCDQSEATVSASDLRFLILHDLSARERHRASLVELRCRKLSRCCTLAEEFADAALEDQLVRFRLQRNRPLYLCSCIGLSLVHGIVFLCAIHERHGSSDPPFVAGLLLLVAAALLFFSAAVLKLQRVLHSHWPFDTAFVVASLLALTGLSLTRPSLVGVSVNCQMFLLMLCCVGCMSTLRRQLATLHAFFATVAALWLLHRPLIQRSSVLHIPGTLVVAAMVAYHVDRVTRGAFETMKRSDVARAELQDDEAFQQSILRARVPLSLMGHVDAARASGRRVAEFWMVEDTVVLFCRGFGGARGPSSSTAQPPPLHPPGLGSPTAAAAMENDSVFVATEQNQRDPTHAACRSRTEDQCEAAEQHPLQTQIELLVKSTHLSVIHMFGDDVLVAGPLDLPAGQHREAQMHRALRQAIKLVECLLLQGMRFTAGLALETAVSVLTHSDFPTFDMYGPAVSTARALMAEAPTPMCVATERVVAVYEGLRARDTGIASRSRLEVCPAQSWRIRGVGSSRVHRLQLAAEAAA